MESASVAHLHQVVADAVVEHRLQARNPSARDNDLIDMEGDERTAFLVEYTLHVMVQSGTFLAVECLACLVQLPIEIGTVPVTLVPRRASPVSFGENLIGGALAPDSGRHRFLRPHVRPIAVSRGLHQVDLDAGRR